MRGWLGVIGLAGLAGAGLLLDEDFSCRRIGCNATGGITNYSFWRWSTTGSAQGAMTVGPAQGGRAGNQVHFGVTYCEPPAPNPDHLGCYRSELALQRQYEHSLIDWRPGQGSSARWFGFSNRLLNFSWAPSPYGLNGPSFQLHGAAGPAAGHSGHPVLNLQVDSTGCAQGNLSCPVWTIGVSAGGPPDPACSEQYDACWVLGPALGPQPGRERAADEGTSEFGLTGRGGPDSPWSDWVVNWRGSPVGSRGFVQVWRNGQLVLPKTYLATAYNDSTGPYLKFGVYHSAWKGQLASPPEARNCDIAYGGLKVGDADSSFDEVSTKQGGVHTQDMVSVAVKTPRAVRSTGEGPAPSQTGACGAPVVARCLRSNDTVYVFGPEDLESRSASQCCAAARAWAPRVSAWQLVSRGGRPTECNLSGNFVPEDRPGFQCTSGHSDSRRV